MVNLIAMDREKVKEAFVFFAEDCKLFAEIVENLRNKSNEPRITSDILNKALNTFEKKSNRPLQTNGKIETIFKMFYGTYAKFGCLPKIGASISVYRFPFYPVFAKESSKNDIYFNEFICRPTPEISSLIIEPNYQHITKITSIVYKPENNYTSNFIVNEFGPLTKKEKHYPATSFPLNPDQPESDLFNSKLPLLRDN